MIIPHIWLPKWLSLDLMGCVGSFQYYECLKLTLKIPRSWGNVKQNIFAFVMFLECGVREIQTEFGYLLFCFGLSFCCYCCCFSLLRKMFDKNNRGKIYFNPCFQRVSTMLSSSVHAAGVPVGSYSYVARKQKILMEAELGLPRPPTYYFSQLLKTT